MAGWNRSDLAPDIDAPIVAVQAGLHARRVTVAQESEVIAEEAQGASSGQGEGRVFASKGQDVDAPFTQTSDRFA